MDRPDTVDLEETWGFWQWMSATIAREGLAGVMAIEEWKIAIEGEWQVVSRLSVKVRVRNEVWALPEGVSDDPRGVMDYWRVRFLPLLMRRAHGDI